MSPTTGLFGIESAMIFIAWFFFALFVGAYGSSKGTWGGFFGGFFISIFFTPVIGLLAVAFSKPEESALIRKGMKKCPYCAEFVKQEAVVCRHCGKELDAK